MNLTAKKRSDRTYQSLLSERCVRGFAPGQIGEYMQVEIRPLRNDEIVLLNEFLYEAIFIPEGAAPPPRDILEKPELRVYTENFGEHQGDNCLVAVTENKVVGAVWTRIMNDYGHVDDETPSFAISLYKDYRNQGIGTRLMKAMLSLLKKQGFKKASLSVQKANYAVRMYEKVGFHTVNENHEEYIMVNELSKYETESFILRP